MAGKVGSGSFGVLLVNGYNLLADKVKAFTHRIESVLERSDGLGDTWEAYTPAGLSRATLSQEGAFFDDTAAQAHALLSPAAGTGTSRVLVFAPAGNTIGQPCVGCEGTYAHAYEVLASLGNLTKANVTYQVSGRMDRGVILQHHAAKTADWNTKTLSAQVDYTTDPSQRVVPITSNSIANPTVVTTTVPHGLTTGDIVLIAGVSTSDPTINGSRTVTVTGDTTFTVPVNVTTGGTGGTLVRANSANGAVGYQAVSAMTGFTGFVGKIQDSADDVTYADLITFANVTAAPAAERATVTGTVDRYLSFDGNVTGSGSITVFCGLARL